MALARELREEGNIELVDQPTLFGVYFNRRISRRDHVALYVVRAFRQDAPPQPNHEIIAHGFFAPDALPAETTRGDARTHRRGAQRAQAGGTLVGDPRHLVCATPLKPSCARHVIDSRAQLL